jgi:hypothetical protein
MKINATKILEGIFPGTPHDFPRITHDYGIGDVINDTINIERFEDNQTTDDTYEADEKFARWLQECDHPVKSINEVKRMSDTAQSRYGIVNELSEKKASLMQKKQQIKDNLEQIELNYKRMGEDLELQKKKGKENITALDEQIKNYDEAIAAIKTISKEEKEKSV